jgi:DNA-binding NarL/FixJ family response regulator
MMPKIKVLIADDHPFAREGFRKLLSLVDFIEVVGEAASAQETVQKALDLRPDVILLDLVWYKDSSAGIVAISRIKAAAPQIKILASTAYPELIEKARHVGADLALDKDSLGNQTFLADRIKDAFEVDTFSPVNVELLEPLSRRELEVLEEMAAGQTAKEIADQLSIDARTVRNHFSNIYGKLGANNRAGAIATAYELGILIRGRRRK